MFVTDFGNTVHDTPWWQFDKILFTCFMGFFDPHNLAES